VRKLVERTVDRTVNMASSLSNLAFLPRRDRWRERLGEIVAPTLVVHGTEDPFFPIGNARALANEVPGARLLVLEHTGHELPRAAWDVVVPALLEHTSGGPTSADGPRPHDTPTDEDHELHPEP
jgi:pimeloyl-ACP methyl ester carboxylesterase